MQQLSKFDLLFPKDDDMSWYFEKENIIDVSLNHLLASKKNDIWLLQSLDMVKQDY